MIKILFYLGNLQREAPPWYVHLLENRDFQVFSKYVKSKEEIQFRDAMEQCATVMIRMDVMVLTK